MKKLFLLALALFMTLGLAACGNTSTESESLVDITTEVGISLKLPSDMTLQENKSYINTKTGDSVSFGVTEDENPLSKWKEENVLATYQSKYKDVEVKSFENGKQINGKESFVATVTLTTPNGNPFTMTLVMVADGNKRYIINFGYGSDNKDSTLAKNLQTCIDSITIKSAK